MDDLVDIINKEIAYKWVKNIENLFMCLSFIMRPH